MKPAAGAPSYTNVYAKALIAEAEQDDRIVAVTAAMPSGTGIDKFAEKFPDRSFDVGIAEQHGVTFCAGMAADGLKPSPPSTQPSCSARMTRSSTMWPSNAYLCALRWTAPAWLAPMASTHQGSYDIGFLASLPNFVLMAPSDEAELMHMVATAAQIDDGPSAIRYPRGESVGVELPDRGTPLPIGKARIVREGTKVAILSYGTRLAEALKAADILQARGLSDHGRRRAFRQTLR